MHGPTPFSRANASVTANSTATVRQGEFYFLNVAAGSRPLWQPITSVSSLGGSTTRYSFIPASSETHTYDADGNLTSDGRWTYTWDAENRLIAMETTSPSVFTHSSVYDARRIDFAYDYLGRRVDKYVRAYNGSAFTTDVARTRFVYNGWNVVAELNGLSSNALLRSNAWGLDLSGTLADGGGVGGLLSIKDGSTFHLPVYDANGNVAGLVDKAAGTLTAAYEYSPFGEGLRATGTYAATNNWRFSTKYTDAETSLLYYGYRYYDAKMGKFLGRDPSGEKGGLNLYGFCNNNPVNCYDVLGLVPDRDYMYQQLYGAGVESDSFLMSCTDEELTNLYLQKLQDGAFDTLSDPWGGEMQDPSAVLNGIFGERPPLPSANSGVTYGGPGMIQGGVTRMDPVNVTAQREGSSQDPTTGGFFSGLAQGLKSAFSLPNLIVTAVITVAAVVASPVVVTALTVAGAVAGAYSVGVAVGTWANNGFAVNPNVAGQVVGQALGTAVTSAGLGAAAGVVRGALAAERTTVTLADDLAAAASRARNTVGPGSGGAYGTRVHSAFEAEVNGLGRGLNTEVSYLNGQVVPRGTPGSVRLDVVNGPVNAPTSIFDLKTGSATLTPARIQQIQSHVPGGGSVPVFEVRP